MNSRWKQYLLYASLIIVGGGIVLILIETVKANNTGFEVKTLWDWMELFIIPLFLAGGAFFLNRSEKEIERKTAEDRAKLEREIASDRQQEDAIQSYLDEMADLLLKEKLRTTKRAEVRDVARIRTLTVLRRLDGRRKGLVIIFLHEAKLLNKGSRIVDLTAADLSDVTLMKGVGLQGADLGYTNMQNANLEYGWLDGISLKNSILKNAKMRSAQLTGAVLTGAVLTSADLKGSNLTSANLEGAILRGADFRDYTFTDVNSTVYNISGARLRGANLKNSILEGAKVSTEQLATAKSIKGAIMPDGTKHD